MIVIEVGGNSEAVPEGKNGRMIAPGDGRALRGALTELHTDLPGTLKMAKASGALGEERFSLKRLCSARSALYFSPCGVVR
jgi:hypothetical protein